MPGGYDLYPLSGIPPEAFLSGLPLPADQTGISGTLDSGGQTAGSGAQGLPGGLSLDELSQLLLSQSDVGGPTGPATGAGMFNPIGGTLGQQSLAQGQGYGINVTTPAGRGPRGNSAYLTAGQTGGGEEALQLLRQALGIAQKGIGAAQSFEGLGGMPGSSAYGETSPIDMIDPTGYSLFDVPGTASPTQALQDALGNFSLADTSLNYVDPAFLQTRGLLEGIDQNTLASLTEEQKSGMLAALMGQESPSMIDAGGLSLGVSPLTQGASMPDTNVLGAAQGGIGSLLGLLNLYGGIKGGNAPGSVSGGLQTLSGALGILKSSPELAADLGLSASTLGGLGTTLGGLGGLLGIYGGVNALENGDTFGGVTGLGTGLYSTYGALSQLGLVPSLSEIVASVAPELAASLGIGAGAGGAGAAAGAAGAAAGAEAAGAAGAAGAGAAGAGAAGGTAAGVMAGLAPVAGLVALPLILAALHPVFQNMDMEPTKVLNQRRNINALGGLEGGLLNAAQNANPLKLLQLAGIGPDYGYGNIQFQSDKYGFGGDYDTPMSNEYAQALERAAQSPTGLADFLRGLKLYTGQTGATQYDPLLTDYYRRELAGRAGLPAQDFEPGQMTQGYRPEDIANEYMAGKFSHLGNWQQGEFGMIGDILGNGLQAEWSPYQGDWLGVPTLHRTPVSQYYRQPGELTLQDPTMRANLASAYTRGLEDYFNQFGSFNGLNLQDPTSQRLMADILSRQTLPQNQNEMYFGSAG